MALSFIQFLLRYCRRHRFLLNNTNKRRLSSVGCSITRTCIIRSGDYSIDIPAEAKTKFDVKDEESPQAYQHQNHQAATMNNHPIPDDDAVAQADKEMEERANRAKAILSQRYVGLKKSQVSLDTILLSNLTRMKKKKVPAFLNPLHLNACRCLSFVRVILFLSPKPTTISLGRT